MQSYTITLHSSIKCLFWGLKESDSMMSNLSWLQHKPPKCFLIKSFLRHVLCITININKDMTRKMINFSLHKEQITGRQDGAFGEVDYILSLQ